MPPLNRNKIDYDYILGEQPLNVNFVTGKPIFRQVYQLAGAQNASTVQTDLHTVIGIFVGGIWTGLDASDWFINAGTGSSGLVLDATGLLTLQHQGVNLSGFVVVAIVEYTKR